jgi:hypothetical protein
MDQSGNSNHGTPMNGVGFHADQWGNPNGAAAFDGVNDWVAFGSALITPEAFTLSFRFRTDVPQGQVLFSKSGYSIPDNHQLRVGFNYPTSLPGDGLFFGSDHDNSCDTSSLSTPHHTTTGNAINPNQWYCVAIVFDNGVKSLYVDGVLAAQQNVSGYANNNSVDSCPGGIFRIGTWWADEPHYFDGLMDEVYIYHRALTVAELDTLCSMTPSAGPRDDMYKRNVLAARVVPNPAAGAADLLIQSQFSKRVGILVTDAAGRIVFRKATMVSQGSNTIQLPVSNVVPGIYAIRITDESGGREHVMWVKE